MLSFVGIAVLTAHSVVHLLNDFDAAQSVLYEVYEYMVLSAVICSIYFCICFVMTLYIVVQPQAQCQTQSVSPGSKIRTEKEAPRSVPEIASKMANHSYSVHHLPRSASTQEVAAGDDGVDISAIRMHHVFRNEHAFKLFIRHLAKEYSVENALFLFESQQFKRHFGRIAGDLSIVIPMMESRGTASISISTSKRSLLANKRPKQRISGLTLSDFSNFCILFQTLSCSDSLIQSGNVKTIMYCLYMYSQFVCPESDDFHSLMTTDILSE